jgi:hypothetical protein
MVTKTFYRKTTKLNFPKWRKKMSEVRDVLGNELKVGDMAILHNDPSKMGLVVARIVEVSSGGISVAVDRNAKGMTPAKVRLVIDMTLTGNPQMPVFPVLCKVVNPASQALLDKVMEGSGEGGMTQ